MSKKTYTMINKQNGARIECTEEFLVEWLARGFEVESVREEKSELFDTDNI